MLGALGIGAEEEDLYRSLVTLGGTSLAGIEANAEGHGTFVGEIARVAWDDPDALRATIEEHGAGRIASFNPAWSPSGARIAYTLFKGPGAHHRCCVGDIWTARADGTDRKPVSTSPRFEYRPDWGPVPP